MAVLPNRQAFRKPTFLIPTISVATLFALFAVYYFLATSRQEESFNLRAFRSLAAVSDQLQSRVINYAPVLEQAAKKAKPDEMLSGAARDNATPKPVAADAVSEYLAEYEPKLHVLRPDQGECRCEPATTVVAATYDGGRYYLEFCTSKNLRVRIAIDDLAADTIQGPSEQMFDEVLLTGASGTILYQTLKGGSRLANLAPLVESAASGNAAKKDEEASDGKPAGGSPGRPGGSRPEAAAGFLGACQSSKLLSAQIAGIDYRLYLVPVPLKLKESARDSAAPPGPAAATPQHPAASPATLVLCGLVQSSRFRSEGLAVPTTALVSLALLLPVVIVGGWPLLKLQFMRPSERIARRAGLYFVSSTLATLILVSMLAIHLRYSVDTGEIDARLKALAQAIDRNLVSELRQTLDVMDSVGRSKTFRDELARAGPIPSGDCKDQDRQLSQKDTVPFPRSNLLSEKGLQLNYYPYFYIITWHDNRGNQRIKWEVAEHPSPSFSAADRSYFRETMADGLWSFSGTDADRYRFRVDPVFSRYTGEYVAVISKQAEPIPICRDTVLTVESLGAPLMSLINPVLPPDFGFAMVDKSGKVLFHSTPARNDSENIFNEVKNGDELRSAVFSRRQTSLNAQYLGVNHRFFVTPLNGIQQSPWSLITFYDVSAQATQRMVLFGSLVLLYYIVVVGALFLRHWAFVRPSQYPPDWVWPRNSNRGIYLHLTLALATLVPVFYRLIFEASLRQILFAAFALPVFGMAVAVLKLKGKDVTLRWIGGVLIAGSFFLCLGAGPHSRRLLYLLMMLGVPVLFLSLGCVTRTFRGFKWPSYRDTFSLVATLVLILSALLPSVAFFKVAHEYYADLTTRLEQVKTMAALADREKRVKDTYRNLHFSSLASPNRTLITARDMGKWLFLHRRLEQTADRYDTEFLSLRPSQIFEPTSSTDIPATPQSGESFGKPDPLPPELVWLASFVPHRLDTVTDQLGQPSPDKSPWSWTREGTNQLHLHQTTRGSDPAMNRSTRALLDSFSNDPMVLSEDLVSSLAVPSISLWAVPVLLLAGLTTFLWIRPTILRLFLLTLKLHDPPLPFGKDEPIAGNLILLAPGSPRDADVLKANENVHFIDVAGVIQGGRIDYWAISKSIVALGHFHFRSEDRAATQEKLEILETLVRRYPEKKVVILTTIDPLSFLDRGGDANLNSAEVLDDAESVERWAAALRGFERRRLETPPRSGEDHRVMWFSCPQRERAVLYQLARDGWANHKSQAEIDQLRLRGVITSRPPFRFADPGFRQFVLDTVSPEDRKKWEMRDTASIWDGARITVLAVVLALVALVLFYNQQATLGYIVTLVSVLTPVIKAFSETRGTHAV